MMRLVDSQPPELSRCLSHGKLDRLVRTISSFGTDVVAGYIVGIRVILSHYCPRGACLMPPRPWWARLWELRIRNAPSARCGKQALYNMIFLGCVGLAFVLLARQIIGLLPPIQRLSLWS